MNRRILTALSTTAVVALTLAGCGGGGGGPLGNAPGGGTAAPGDVIRIGSADFSESTLLAEIYAGALQSKGIKTERATLGTRETYFPALKDGSIDLIPDYTGVLLKYLDRQATQTSSDDVYSALQKVVPAPLTVLDKSPAEDKDAVVVTKETAQRYNARSIADLAPHCSELVFGGPSEFQTRADGIPGIKEKYNCTFRSYRSLDTGPVTVKALADGTVQAADIFTTSSAIGENGFVVLEDPKGNFAAQNVVPLINAKKATPQVRQVLNMVSAKLTTQSLLDLNAKVNAPDKPNMSTVAKEWLTQNNLG